MRNGRNIRSAYNNTQDSAADFLLYPEWFLKQGLRTCDLLISIDKGKTSEIAKQIFKADPNIFFISGRVNAVANVVAHVYFTDSMMLRDIMERIKALPFVNRMEFSEVVEVIGRKSTSQIKDNATKLLDSSGGKW